jgi:hypothetical protein
LRNIFSPQVRILFFPCATQSQKDCYRTTIAGDLEIAYAIPFSLMSNWTLSMCAGAPKIRCLSSESQRVVPGDTEQETSLKVLSELLTSGNNQDVVGDGSMVKTKAEYLH